MLRDWVKFGREKGASDLLLEAGTPPVLRVRGELFPFGEALPNEGLLQTARELLGGPLWSEFLERRSADLSQTISGTRCRINVYQTIRGIGLAVRLLTSFQAGIRDCNLHPDLKRLIEAKAGLLIISGPTGSGKSTTLAALIGEINQSQRKHIITIESPVEYFFQNRQSFIRQREVPYHSPSFEQAITDSMRENPDILVIGEMRTPDVMRLTLNAAETGHLVLATMHSSSCADAMARLCMSFPAEIQSGVRAQLADCLIGVICQRLEYLPGPDLRVPLCEVLVASSASRAIARSGQFSQIATALQAGGEEGMWTIERYQRWIDGKRDWIRPSQAAPLPVTGEESRSLPQASPSARKAEAPQPRAIRSSVAKAPEAESTRPSPEGRIEIAGEEGDLESLAERISKISEE